MSTADDISLWYEAVQFYDAGRVHEAIEIFKQTKQNAKMMLNIGCCYLRKHDLKSATEVPLQLQGIRKKSTLFESVIFVQK